MAASGTQRPLTGSVAPEQESKSPGKGTTGSGFRKFEIRAEGGARFIEATLSTLLQTGELNETIFWRVSLSVSFVTTPFLTNVKSLGWRSAFYIQVAVYLPWQIYSIITSYTPPPSHLFYLLASSIALAAAASKSSKACSGSPLSAI